MKMKKSFFWTETALVRAEVLALGLFIAMPWMIAKTVAGDAQLTQAAQSSSVQPQAYEGMITDTQCGARHSASIGMAAADCTRVCVHGGEHFALIHDEAVYVLEGDLASLKHVASQRVRIVGTLNGNKISVESVAAI
jgi:hypothetical protein